MQFVNGQIHNTTVAQHFYDVKTYFVMLRYQRLLRYFYKRNLLASLSLVSNVYQMLYNILDFSFR